MLLTTVAVIVVLITLLWKFGSYNHDFFNKLGIEGPRPWPFIGNLLTIIKHGMYELDLKWKKEFGTVYGTFQGSVPFLIISDKELIRQICIKEAHLFTDRFTFDVSNPPLDKAVTALKGAEWKRVRTILTPTFTAGKLKKMTSLIRDAVGTFNNRLCQAAESQEDVDIKSYYSGLTIDVIARTMFGVQVNCQENPDDEFYVYCKKLFQFSFANPWLLLLLFWPGAAKYIKRWRPDGFLPANVRDYFLGTVQKAIEVRRKADKSQSHYDFLALMLKAREKAEKAGDTQSQENTSKPPNTVHTDNKWTASSSSSSHGLSEEELISQSFIFLIAGFETTASTLQFCSYFLAKHPEYQDQCREEIIDVLGNEVPDYENVSKLQFLDQCITETLRICPPALRFDRVSSETVKLKDSDGREFTIPKGMSVQVSVHGIHNDPDIYENPETFDPVRFSPDEMERRKHNYEYMPFGLGPRNCIGMRFALLEIKLALATVLKSMKFVPCDKTCAKLEFARAGLLQSKTPIILRIEKLTN